MIRDGATDLAGVTDNAVPVTGRTADTELLHVAVVHDRVVAAPDTHEAEHQVTGLTEHQLLVVMNRAVWNDFPDLFSHQVNELVYKE